MKKIKLYSLALTAVTVLGFASTSGVTVLADEISPADTVNMVNSIPIDSPINTPALTSDEDSNMQPELIYTDDEGNVFTQTEVLVQKGESDPRITYHSISASPIVIGVLWTYTTSASGTSLRNSFRNVAISEYTVGGIAGALGVAGIATARLTTVLAAFVAAGGATVAARFTEAADKIVDHPSSGKIYMYVDHVTYQSL